MGLTSWIKKKVEGDPVENKFRKEAKAEAKAKETELFHEAYKEELMIAAGEKARARAKALAQKGSSGSGIMNTLGSFGDKMNKASAGLTKGIEINPGGANETFNVNDPFTPTSGYDRGYDREPRHKRKKQSSYEQPYENFNGADPFSPSYDGSPRHKRKNQSSLEVVDPFDV